MNPIRPIDTWFIEEVLPHEPQYLAVARRLTGGGDEAADLVQDAFAKLLSVDGWSAITNPRSYVIRILYNLAIERMRRAQVVEFRPLPDAGALESIDDAPDSFRIVAAQDQLRRTQAAVAALPERCRVVLIRRRFHNESPRDIARDLGISLSTFEKRLARAIELLTLALAPPEPHGEQHWPGSHCSEAIG